MGFTARTSCDKAGSNSGFTTLLSLSLSLHGFFAGDGLSGVGSVSVVCFNGTVLLAKISDPGIGELAKVGVDRKYGLDGAAGKKSARVNRSL